MAKLVITINRTGLPGVEIHQIDLGVGIDLRETVQGCIRKIIPTWDNWVGDNAREKKRYWDILSMPSNSPIILAMIMAYNTDMGMQVSIIATTR